MRFFHRHRAVFDTARHDEQLARAEIHRASMIGSPSEHDPTAALLAPRPELTRFVMRYKFAVDEVTTKMSILREEFRELHDYNPIEHLNARLKTPESILAKALRRGVDPTFDDLRRHVRDIAGVRC